MSNYITIISKEEIMQPSQSFGWILFAICCGILLIPTIISYIIVKIKYKRLTKVVLHVELIAGAVALVFSVISGIVLVPKFAEPTGNYSYKATINKDKITVSEYEDFIEQYKPEIRDGYYYFEYKDLE